MKKRNIFAVIIFSIITFGIYDLFWLASTKRVLNEKNKEHVPTLWLLFAPILMLVLVAILQYVVHLSSNGTSNSVVNIISILLGIAGVLGVIIVPFYWFFKYSKAVNEYTNGAMSTAVTFLLLYLLRFIGLALVQDKYNDMIDAGTDVNPVTPASAPNSLASPASPPPADVAPTQPSVTTPLPTTSDPAATSISAPSVTPVAVTPEVPNSTPAIPETPPIAPVMPVEPSASSPVMTPVPPVAEPSFPESTTESSIVSPTQPPSDETH